MGKKLFRLGRVLGRSLIRAIFRGWKSACKDLDLPVGVFHAVFGHCQCQFVKQYLRLGHTAVCHRRRVNGMIKLERNLWLSDKADQLDQAFLSGDMHSMYSELGAITRFAKTKSSSIKICRVNNADGIPTQSFREEKTSFREHFGKTMCAQTQSY